MMSFGLFHEEEDSLKDLSIELTSHKEWLDRIKIQGNKPEDWAEFIEHIKAQISVPYESFWNRYICDLYVMAFKTIQGKCNVMFVKLFIDYANLKSEDNADDGRILFSQARSIARKFSIAHIAAAEFELKQGNKAKCQKILEKAEIFGAEPVDLLKKAIKNLNAGKSYLLTADEKAHYFEQKNEKVEEKPSLTSSMSLPEGSNKNKFLTDIMASQAPVIGRIKSVPHTASEKVSQPPDPFGSSEKWVSGSLLSEKWGSSGNFPSSDRRLSSILSGPDRRLSSIHNVVDRRLSSIHSVTDRRISNIHSTASHGLAEKPPLTTSSSSSLLAHHMTPDCNKPHGNTDSSGSSSSSISKLVNVTSMPRRVKIKSKSQYDFDDDSDEDNNTVYNFKSSMSSAMVGRSFNNKFQSDPITEEDDAIDSSKSSIKGQECSKNDKIDQESHNIFQINERNVQDKINSNVNDTESDKEDDDFPQFPALSKFSLGFMRNRGEAPYLLSASSSLSTSALSASTSCIAGEKSKLSASSVGLSKSRSTLNQLLLETDNLLASTNVAPHVFVEPKPVTNIVRPTQAKCHPDTPRPGTGTPPVAASKEDNIAPPSRRCLGISLDTAVKASSPSTCDSSTLSETLKASMITVRENINDTVLFEGKPVDNILTASATKHKIPQESTLSSSSSSLAKKPVMSNISHFDNRDKADIALFQPNSAVAVSCDKENQPSSFVTPAKFKTHIESSQHHFQERLSESIEVTPQLVKFKPDGLSESAVERVKPHADTDTVEQLEKAKSVDSGQAYKQQKLLPDKTPNHPNKALAHDELREAGEAVILECKPDVNQKPRILQKQLMSDNLSLSCNEKPKLNSDGHHLGVDAKFNSLSQQSVVLAPKKEQPLRNNAQGCENEFVAPQPLMDKRKINKGPNDQAQLEKHPSKSLQPKTQMQPQKPAQGKPIAQQNREENPVASSQGPVTYTLNLNQPIQGKKPRSLIVNGKTYMILKMVGRGGSSKVYQVLDQSYNMLAVKHIDFEGATEATIQSYMNEVTLLKRLQYSDLVVKLFDYELDYTENCLYLVLECGETDLATMFKNRTKKERVPREMVKFYWGEMLRAVQVLHKEGIVHSDLKPANFLIVGGNLKLIDFGIAGVIQNDRTSMTRDTQMGTLNYMSPETIMEMQSDTGSRLHKFKISVKSDVWSLGCILYSMIYGKTPFQHITNPTMKLQAIINASHHIEFGDEYDTDLLDTMKRCLRRNPKERLSIGELLQHPYLAEKTKAVPTEENVTNSPSGDMNNLVADVHSILKKLADTNVASPNTIKTLKQTLQQLGPKKEMNEVLNQLPNNKKCSSPDVNSKPEIIRKVEPKQKFANGGVKEVRAPLQCLNLKDLRREKVGKDS